MVVTICGIPDVVLNVATADRDAVVVFCATVNTTDALPEPDAGLTVSHDAFDDADHVVFEVNDIDRLDAAALVPHPEYAIDSIDGTPVLAVTV